jgi:hypothetical protein
VKGWQRMVPRALVLVGVAVALLELVPAVPRDHTLVFRLERAAAVQRLDATWTPVGEAEAAGGVSLRFDREPPRHIHHSVSLPDGDYVIAVAVEADADKTTYTRRVTLQGGETTIPLSEVR